MILNFCFVIIVFIDSLNQLHGRRVESIHINRRCPPLHWKIAALITRTLQRRCVWTNCIDFLKNAVVHENDFCHLLKLSEELIIKRWSCKLFHCGLFQEVFLILMFKWFEVFKNETTRLEFLFTKLAWFRNWWPLILKICLIIISQYSLVSGINITFKFSAFCQKLCDQRIETFNSFFSTISD